MRIFKLDVVEWNKVVHFDKVFPAPLHVSVLNALAYENIRATPQQSISTITNVDDIETFIQTVEAPRATKYLEAIDLKATDRQEVMRELALMGVTAGSLFPGSRWNLREPEGAELLVSPARLGARAPRRDEPHNDVAIALLRPPHGREPVDPDLLQPDRALAALVGLFSLITACYIPPVGWGEPEYRWYLRGGRRAYAQWAYFPADGCRRRVQRADAAAGVQGGWRNL